jgi:hypothetical protein
MHMDIQYFRYKFKAFINGLVKLVGACMVEGVYRARG